MKLLVTGGAGFIGSAVVRLAIARGLSVVNLDKLTYSANLASLVSVQDHPAYAFEQADIVDAPAVAAILEKHQPDAVMHLAAESHVDRSIDGPLAFIHTNVTGTAVLLEAVRRYVAGMPQGRREAFRFHHVSTDEVFGALGVDDPPFDETTAYAPNSPYSASKAASDHLVRAWGETFGVPFVLTNCSNNYGPFQFPEKLIPVTVLRALAGQSIPVYGKGLNVRDWLFVDDHAEALLLVLEKGRLGQTYCIGGEAERRNIDLVASLCGVLDQIAPKTTPHADLISFVTDRPGHDLRYAIDIAKVREELGWSPRTSLGEGLELTARWYIDNRSWWEPLLAREGVGRRLGLSPR
ncbi:dTDP-glucose 4,6-dehydratase [Caulobacter sp. NIBR2454]|uniref:dTDP-glucose 4,6-dehydratase n=1 Tax=Caulobacter sp. NIBR2454 TaxID=3015996 RepID=UPI0022B6771E|nr:dTDP-glucose 4,6-dehydratase [Caulobacter sp. NIBR2454]